MICVGGPWPGVNGLVSHDKEYMFCYIDLINKVHDIAFTRAGSGRDLFASVWIRWFSAFV